MKFATVNVNLDVKIANAKFEPLFWPTRLPLIKSENGKIVEGHWDVVRRCTVANDPDLARDYDQPEIPPDRIVDPGHLRTRYYIYYGGRGGAKSHQLATALVLRCLEKKIKVLCAREIQSSIADSVLALLELKINALGVSEYFQVLNNEIRCTLTGSEIAFRGLRSNINELKSFEDADICWIEEAADVSEDSWDKIDPTIRKKGSEIWISFNPDLADDPTYVKFVTNADEDMTSVKVYWYENSELDAMNIKLALKMKKAAPTKYEWIWGGNPRVTKEGGIFVPEMISQVPAAAAGTRWVRGWDLASTAIDPKKPNKEPAFTVGLLMGKQPNGRYVIGHIDRFREKPHIVEQRIGINLNNDKAAWGWGVEHSIPQDPGQAGKSQVSHFARLFAGWLLHFSPETGSKATRAAPFAAQVNAGNVDIVTGPWVKDFLAELETFSGEEAPGLFLDQVDAASRAFERLMAPQAHTMVKISGL
jgi:predicted phage terminase large subunit-like protein